MELDDNERKILTLLDENPVKGSIELIQKFVSLEENEIRDVINQLLKLNLLEIITLPDGDWYFNTSKVSNVMIDVDLARKLDSPAYHRFWVEIQNEKPEYITTASEELEKKVKPE